MLIQLVNCPSARVAVVASSSPAPVITLQGKTLSSNIVSGNQWYLNDTAIVGSTGQTQTANLPGVYKDRVTDALGCAQFSNTIVYTPGNSIGLTIGPNPNKGQFNVQFFITQTQDIAISLVNDLGQRVYSSAYPNFTGAFSQQVNAPNLGPGIYFLKIDVGSKRYVEKILIE